MRPLSVDPHIHYFSPRHLPYVAPAITIIVILGVLLPLLLILYPTCCGSRYFGGRVVKTFIEAFQGSYKDGTNGTRDYRAVSALYLVCRVVIWTFGTSYLKNHPSFLGMRLISSLTSMIGVAFFGFARPCKSSTHNLLDVLILTLLAVHAVYAIQGTTDYSTHELDTQIALGFLPLLAVSVYTLGRALRLPVRFVIKRCQI